MATVPAENEPKAGSSEEGLTEIYERPRGIKGAYYNPMTQVVLLGFVCFMCPGEWRYYWSFFVVYAIKVSSMH